MQTDQNGATLNEAALGKYNQGCTASCPPPPVLGFQLQSLSLSVFPRPLPQLGFSPESRACNKGSHIDSLLLDKILENRIEV